MHALLVGAGVAALVGGWPALAQESGMRGAVDEQEINQELLPGASMASGRPTLGRAAPALQENAPVPPYRPTTVAVDEPSAADGAQPSLFQNNDAAEAAFGAAPAPVPTMRPSTARERTEAARQRLAQPPQTPTGRVAAETATDEDITTGTVRVDTVDSEIDLTVDRGAERAEAIEGLDREPEQNPYAPLGLRLGTFIVTPSAETGITATSNADSSPDGSSAVLSETILRLNGVSDWSRHSAAFETYGSLRESISGQELDEKEFGIKGSTIIELGNEFRAVAGAGYVIKPESASSPVIIEDTTSRPIRQIIDANLGLEKDVGKLRLGIDGNIERDWYGDAELSSGGTVSQRDRDSTLATLNLRTGYEISPALTPFVAVEVGRRFYDEKQDASGFERSADRLGARAGLEFDFGEKLSGEFSAGWLREKLDDDRLAPVSGATVDANINWSPQRGTNVSLLGSTIIEGTTTPGESGSILYAGRLNVEREIRANLTANVALGAAYRDYTGSDGRDVIFSAEAGATYWFNRYFGLVGRARHEELNSNLPDRDSKTDSVFLGVKMQR
ncbi:outer membrane beta-barrel protein [Neomesorhizobium albiziae]|uniref:outer membrane beta-barrel protein n=1 Tax=Neomesorhizobium albiziae TaxID=335020 RepID=UPI001FCEAE1C|nr:outer membrane beta-barrel protein [Mesorhizobium albiziae]